MELVIDKLTLTLVCLADFLFFPLTGTQFPHSDEREGHAMNFIGNMNRLGIKFMEDDVIVLTTTKIPMFVSFYSESGN